jgi:type I restriction enzyme S subunit
MSVKASARLVPTTIGGLGRVVTGRTPSSNNPHHFGNKYPFITPSDIDGIHRSVQTARGVSEEGKQHLSRIVLPTGSTCFVCIGATIGKVCYTNRPSVTNQQINSVIVDQEKHDPVFVFYLLTTLKELVKAKAGGAATPIVNKSSFEEIPISVPLLETQREIAGILGAYDDLIENNRRRIQILEEMARNLYREWFVHFRFPGHENVKLIDTEHGKIPQGWEWKSIGKSFESLGGGTPSKKIPEYWETGDINWYTPSDLTKSGSMFIENSASKITELGLKKSSAKLFPELSVMMTSRATLGVLSINGTEACTNQGFITCIPNKCVPLMFLYFSLETMENEIASNASGATFKEITKGVFRKMPFLHPANDIIRQFENFCLQIQLEIRNLLKKNRNLTETRDILLPKLLKTNN